MKYIKQYKIFESFGRLGEVRDIYQDFLDKFNINTELKSGNDVINLHNPSDYDLNFTISSYNRQFGKGIQISFGNRNRKYIKVGNYKGFDGIQSDKIREELEKAHKICLDYFGFTDSIVGSSYIHSGGFNITYFTETPKYIFESYPISPNYLYSTDYYVRELPIVGGYVRCGLNLHPNLFDFYTNSNQINGMFAIWGGSDKTHIYNPISIMSGRDCDKYGYCTPNTPVEQWIDGEWSKVCKELKIPKPKVDGRWRMSIEYKWNLGINTLKFMDILVDNQEAFKNYTQLPKVNQTR